MNHLCGQIEPAAEIFCHIFDRNLLPVRNDAAGDQRRLMQGKGIVRIAGILQLTDFRKCLLCTAVLAGQHDLIARNLFHNCLDRILSVQLHRRIQHRSAVLHAVWRRIAPAAAPVDAHGQAYHHFLLLHFCRRIVGKPCHRPDKNRVSDRIQAQVKILILLRQTGQRIINPYFPGKFKQLLFVQLFRQTAKLPDYTRIDLPVEHLHRLMEIILFVDGLQQGFDFYLILQLILPGQNRRHIRLVEAVF